MNQRELLDVLHKLQESNALTLGIYVPGSGQSKLSQARELQREAIITLRRMTGDQASQPEMVRL